MFVNTVSDREQMKLWPKQQKGIKRSIREGNVCRATCPLKADGKTVCLFVDPLLAAEAFDAINI